VSLALRAWLILFTPLLYVVALDPLSFTMGFNQGRGGFLLASILLSLDYLYSKPLPQRSFSGVRALLIAVLLGSALAYFTAAVFFNLHGWLWSLGEAWLGINLLHSWIWLFDYLVYAVYVALAVALTFGAEGLRLLLTGVMYLAGMCVVLALDTFFPFDALGGLQYVVPLILSIDLLLLRSMGVSAAVEGNAIAVQGARGPAALAVFWPSAGVHSVVIYSLVMLALLIRMEGVSRARGALYFTLGAIGTFFINVLRVFLLSCYLVMVGASGFESFHALAGEALFLPWVFGYTLFVGRRASRRAG
jgi:thaumarchaeosortase